MASTPAPKVTDASDVTHKSMHGKLAVITGGAGGIGLAIGKEVIARGGRAVILDKAGKNQELIAKITSELGSDNWDYIPCDITMPESLETAMRDIKSNISEKIDYLINAAGIEGRGILTPNPEHPLKQTPAGFKNTIDVNLIGTYNAIDAALPYMNEGSAILNISSAFGLAPPPEMAAYAASKRGVNALTEVAAIDLAPRGITVNTLTPAYVKTPMVTKGIKEKAALHAQTSADQINETHPMFGAIEHIMLKPQGGTYIDMNEITTKAADGLEGMLPGQKTGADIPIYARLLETAKGTEGYTVFDQEKQLDPVTALNEKLAARHAAAAKSTETGIE